LSDVTGTPERLVWTGKPGGARLWHRPELSAESRAASLGTIACTHEPQVVAGAVTHLCFEYRAPPGGLPAGSRLRIAWSWPFDWRPVAPDEPIAQVCIDAIDADLPADHVPRGAFDPWQHQLDIDLSTPLVAGQILQVRPGGTSGWLAPTFTCDAVDFVVAVWCPHDPRWNLVGKPTAPDVVAGEAIRGVAVASGDAVVGEPVEVRLRLEDVWGNMTSLKGAVPRLVEEADVERLDVHGSDSPPGSIFTLRFQAPGVRRPRFGIPGIGTTVCHPITVHAEAPGQRLYFGDLHSGQTDVGCGAGSLSSHFDHARAVGLQFTSQQANDHYITRQRWKSIRQDTDAAHDPGNSLPSSAASGRRRR
jgi:hypothetical protein